jgi:uncharacterized protein with ParB-like and HNH nuclease domain
MDAKLYELESFKSDLFEIPQFQRTYAWRNDDWESFWTTIAEAGINIELGNSNQVIPPVFMGAIVLQELPQVRIGGSQFDRFAIIDGQQRFVTFSVFAAVLRDFYFGTGSDLWERVSERFLTVSTSLDNKEIKTRITLQEKDQKAYEQIISKKDELDWKKCYEGKHPLNKLYEFFWEKLSTPILDHFEQISTADSIAEEDSSDSEISKDKKEAKFAKFLIPGSQRSFKDDELFDPNTLADLLDKYIKLAVIKIGTTDNEIAFEVFDTLNAKGVELSEVDKFKNGYFMLLPSDSQEIYQKYWMPIENASEKYQYLSLEQFFHEETIRRFGWTPSDKTYQKLMTHIKVQARSSSSVSGKINQDEYRRSVTQQLGDIRESYNSYEIVKTGEDKLAGKDTLGKKYLNYLQFFKRLGVVPLTPILMDLVKFTEGQRANKEIMKELLSCLHSLQTFVARRVLAGVPPQQLRSSVSSLSKDLAIFTIECSPQNLINYKKKLDQILVSKGSDRFPSDSVLLSNVNRDIYNRTGKKESLFVVIWELQRELSKEDEQNLIPAYGSSKDSFSIEHVLPQGTKKNDKDQEIMDSEWRKLWDGWKVKDAELQFMSTVHSIGNLTLLQNQVNSMVSNTVFNEKIKIYKDNTRLKISDDIINAERWAPEEITLRAKKLLNLAIKRWPYPEVD